MILSIYNNFAFGGGVFPKVKSGIFTKIKSLIEEVTLYWNHPRPGEYVPYKEIVMLSIGWLAQYFIVQFSIGFSVGTAFAGETLGINNRELHSFAVC